MPMFVTRRLSIPVWVVIVALVAVFQPSATIGANVFLLLVVGIVAPVTSLIILSLRQHAHAAGRSERRRK
jgi:hypothetical protein